MPFETCTGGPPTGNRCGGTPEDAGPDSTNQGIKNRNVGTVLPDRANLEVLDVDQPPLFVMSKLPNRRLLPLALPALCLDELHLKFA